MKSPLSIAILACTQLIMLNGCGLQQATEQIVIGTDTILIDGSSGSVKVFRTTGTGVKTELVDTGAAQRMAWTLSKIGADRLRLATGDVGSFDIFKDGTDWLVVPTGTFLSPVKTKAVKLTAEGPNVRAKIGETKPPYTDMEISEQTVILAKVADKLTVRWTNGDLAEVLDPSGRVVATLHWKNPAAIPIATDPTKR